MQAKAINQFSKSLASSLASAVLALAGTLMLVAGPAQADFGVAAFDQQITADSSGVPFSQAGGHPYAITTEIDLNRLADAVLPEPVIDPDAKDIFTEEPPGLFGNPSGMAKCTALQLSPNNGEAFPAPECPVTSQVGVITLNLEFIFPHFELTVPLFNMVPPVKQPARFGFDVLGEPIFLDGNVRSGDDFGATVGSHDIPIALPLNAVRVTFWGTPADPSHDFQRCDTKTLPKASEGEHEGVPTCPAASPAESPHADPDPPKAFLTLPVSCSAPGTAPEVRVRADSWKAPGVWDERSIFNHLPPNYPVAPDERGAPQGFTDCAVVPFKPSISMRPTNSQADTPTGLNIDIALPQEGLANPQGIATADVKDAVVTLPAGEGISPSAADGLGGCSLDQIGLGSGAPAACPDSSKLGSVEIDTPLLDDPLQGSIFLGSPECSPCSVQDDLAGRMVKLYIVVEGHGVVLKLPGHVELDPVTGQVKTEFDDNPQLPFDHLRLNFKAGPRSPLVNPHACGSYQATAHFTPWSGNAAVDTTTSFQITSGPGGGACPGSPQAFGPAFAAGTTNNQAGAFSPMTLTLGRNDGEQQLGGITLTTPPGLLGVIAGIPRCTEAQANAGACAAASQIGTVTAGVGAGANPFYVSDGRVFLTDGYKSAPFGLSIVVPAVAGPFNLGTVVVRASIKLDPVTSALTIAADPLPTILDGIPLDIRAVHVDIDRPNFIINPTNCDALALRGTLTGDLGTTEIATSRFQVTNCGRLGFTPKFAASTSGKTSRIGGAALHVKLSYPSGAMGKQANIKSVKVELPKSLPSRLTTLQKACTAKAFEANPASCPAESVVGHAIVHTQLLPVPLEGPAYFVSNGGAAFPNLILVLQGYGVTVQLIGDTLIKDGVTSSTFASTPDVPFEMFDLTLGAGPHSALAANGNLCRQSLVMPTVFVAQDGATLEQNTHIGVDDCPNALTVGSKRIRGRTVTLGVWVPAAGHLSASGQGLAAVSRVSHGREKVRLTLHARRRGKFTSKVRLSFTPSSGKDRKKLIKSVKVQV